MEANSRKWFPCRNRVSRSRSSQRGGSETHLEKRQEDLSLAVDFAHQNIQLTKNAVFYRIS